MDRVKLEEDTTDRLKLKAMLALEACYLETLEQLPEKFSTTEGSCHCRLYAHGRSNLRAGSTAMQRIRKKQQERGIFFGSIRKFRSGAKANLELPPHSPSAGELGGLTSSPSS